MPSDDERRLALVREMSRSQDEAQARTAKVQAFCAAGDLRAAVDTYAALRRDARVSGQIGWGVGAAMASAAAELALVYCRARDIDVVASIRDDLVLLLARDDLGPLEGMHGIAAISRIVSATLELGQVELARSLLEAGARAVALAPFLEELHAASVARVEAAEGRRP
jgi:hypothetical protein